MRTHVWIGEGYFGIKRVCSVHAQIYIGPFAQLAKAVANQARSKKHGVGCDGHLIDQRLQSFGERSFGPHTCAWCGAADDRFEKMCADQETSAFDAGV